MNLSKFQETVEDGGAWSAAVMGLQRVRHDLGNWTTKLSMESEWGSRGVESMRENHLTWVIMRFSLDKEGGKSDGLEGADGLSLKSMFRMRERTWEKGLDNGSLIHKKSVEYLQWSWFGYPGISIDWKHNSEGKSNWTHIYWDPIMQNKHFRK